MAREYARVRVNMWIDDDDWRDLTPAAQHLYKVLLTSPDLSYCGVTDWRPGRLAPRARGWTPEQVVLAAAELTERLYLIPDPDTEEVLIRSFIRHDGLMKESRVAVSMVKAFGAVASNTIRGVIVHELRRLHDEDASLNGWRTTRGEPGQALKLLTLNAIDPTDLAPHLADRLGVGFGVGLAQASPNVWGSVWGSTSPAPTPTPTPSTSNEVEKELLPRKRGHRLPDDFTPDDNLRAWAKERGFNDGQINEMTDRFADHWHSATGSGATKSDWNRAWRNWVGREDPRRVRGTASMYDVSKLPEPGTGWSEHQLDMVLGKDTWQVPDPPDEMNEDDGFLWQQQERRRRFALRVQDALKATGRTA